MAAKPETSAQSTTRKQPQRAAITFEEVQMHAQTPRKRQPMSEEQRAKLSAAQRAYVANDPRWSEHRRKLAAAQEARRMTLWPNEIAAIVNLRRKGRTFSYIAEEIGVCRDVIGRELTELGISTDRVKSDRRARRGNGFWRSFD